MDMKRRTIEWQQFVDMRLREGKKITAIVDELAHITGQSAATVWKWKKGEKAPGIAAQRLLDIWWYLPEEESKAFFS